MTDRSALHIAADMLSKEAAARAADPTTPDELLNEAAATAAEARSMLAHIERSRDAQPERLAEMRARADAERTMARVIEPWMDTVSALPTTDSAGQFNGMLGLPSLDAKALWGTRLAFDLVSRDTPAKEILSELFSDITDIDHLMLVLAEACEVFAESIVTPLLDVIERQGADYDTRVNLADAARNAWAARASNLAEHLDDEGCE